MKRIAFRVDSSSIIGNGHLMRCLSLAHQLKTMGYDILFICKNHCGNLNHLITQYNYQLITLTQGDIAVLHEDTNTWLSSTQLVDASAVIKQIANLAIDLLIVDHYAIDSKWHKLLRPYCQLVMVIDDLANRDYNCDLLLDQTLDRDDRLYRRKTPQHCKLLLGSEFMLLRDEFSQLRNEAFKKRQGTQFIKPVQIIITMGGSDPDNLSEIVVKGLADLLNTNTDLVATLVISSNAPHLKRLHHLAASYHWLTLAINSNNIARLMVNADIAIGASGSTAWERCCLGLPCLTVVCADNQELVASTLSMHRASWVIGRYDVLTRNLVSEQLSKLLNNRKEYELLSKNAFSICDGKGTQRVANVIKNLLDVNLVPATTQHCRQVFNWQSNHELRKYFNNPSAPSWHEHVDWYDASLKNPNRKLYIIKFNGSPAGVLRLDLALSSPTFTSLSSNIYEISILLAPECQGKGIGVTAIHLLNNIVDNAHIIANVHKDNIASHKMFIKAGFNQLSATQYQYTTPSKTDENTY